MINNSVSIRKNINWLTAFVVLVVVSALVSGCGAEESSKIHRVGILNGFAPFTDIAEGFKAEMAELGYKEGENIVYDVQVANFDPAEEAQIIQQFVDDDVDLIFTFATEAALSAKTGTAGTDVPVVFAFGVLEGNDLIDSVRQPGGNITGVRFPGPDLSVKRFEILHEMAPHIKQVGIIYNANYPANQSQLDELHPALASKGVSVVEIPVTSVADIEADLQARTASDDIGMDAILIITDDLSQSPDGWPLISQFAANHNIPIAGSAAFEADTGAVLSYIPNGFATGQLAASIADKVLKGTAAGEIPVVTPEADLRINYALAQELGLIVDKGLLSQAADIIY
jgi:putative ABC transport system substrate-binding protein